MPSVGTQMYWHEAPTPIPPWLSEEQRSANVALARLLKDERITPIVGNAYLVGNRAVELARERTRLKDARSVLLNVGKRALKVEPLLSHRCVLNMLLGSLGAAPLSHVECVELVQQVRSTLLQSDFPMVACVQAVARSRGLEVRSLSRDELKHRRCTFFPNDLVPGKRTLLICSKIEPLFVGVYTEWLPSRRSMGRAAKRGVNGAMRVLCPAHQPQPWHKRMRLLKQIDRNETLCMYLALPDDARALDQELAAAEAARKKKMRKPVVADRGKVKESALRRPIEVGGTVAESDASDVVSDDLSLLDTSSGDEESTDWSDVDEEALEIGSNELIGPQSVVAAGALEIASSGNGTIGLSEASSAQKGRPRLTMLAPIQLEPNSNITDPFAMLPSANSVVTASVLESLKNIRARSSATWTQRLLKVQDRQLLYNLTQSQMAMMMTD